MKLNHYHNILIDMIPISSAVTVAIRIMQSFRYFRSAFLQLYNKWKGNDVDMDKIFSHLPAALTFISANEYIHIYKFSKYYHAYACL
jgi:hypothetical protein